MIEVNVVNNNELLFYFIADQLLTRSALLVCWTDDEGGQYDILFSRPLPVGAPGRRYKCGDIFVAISGWGACHFDVHGDSSVSYYKEKLGVYSEKMTELLNSVRAKISDQYKKKGL